jgi:asparagine synthase (glutamine-hydrolysing)
MAFSLEARCPLIDHYLVEWAMRLPTRLKLHDGRSKYLLRKVLCRYLPRDMIYQPKKGFGVPVGDWLRGPLRNWATQLLHESAAMDCLPLRHDTVRSLFAEHVAGRRNAAPLLWAILMLICFISREDRRFGLPDIGRLQAA